MPRNRAIPKRIVPLAMYISVVGLGIFYTVLCWAGLSAYPKLDDAINVAQNNSADILFPAGDTVHRQLGRSRDERT